MGKTKKRHRGRPIVNGGRKLMVSILFTKPQIDFLDSKINYGEREMGSRSAVARRIITTAKEDNLV